MTLYSLDIRKLEEIEEAINEAVRFIQKARIAHGSLKTEVESFYHAPSYAAAKRASLDLTKSLAQMRRARR